MYIKAAVKPVNKGHQRERKHMVFIDKRSLFQFSLFYQSLLKCDLYLQCGLYSEVTFTQV